LGFPLVVFLHLIFVGDVLLVDLDFIGDLLGHLDFARDFNTFLFSNHSRHLSRYRPSRVLWPSRGTTTVVHSDRHVIPTAVSPGLYWCDDSHLLDLSLPDSPLDGLHLPPFLVLFDHFFAVADGLDLCVGLFGDSDGLGEFDAFGFVEFALDFFGLGDP